METSFKNNIALHFFKRQKKILFHQYRVVVDTKYSMENVTPMDEKQAKVRIPNKKQNAHAKQKKKNKNRAIAAFVEVAQHIINHWPAPTFTVTLTSFFFF